MKHCLLGLLFLLSFQKPVLASIDLTISDLTPKDDHYQVTAVVTGMSSSSGTFVQGMFTPAGASKYFGFIFSKKGEWLNYVSSPEKNYVLENYIELKNDQPISIFLKPDYNDKDYSGPGKYLVKLKRFTASGSPSDYSNAIELDLTYTTPTPQPTAANTPTSTPTPSPTPTATKPVTATQTPTPPPKTQTPTANLKTTVTSTAVLITSQSTIRSTAVLSPASQAGQVLATTASEIFIATNTPSTTYHFQAELSFATPSSSTVSDKTLFVIGAGIFSLSGSLLYFRLKNL